MGRSPAFADDVAKWIRVTHLCSEFNCLPYTGGLFDQPHEAVVKMDVVLRARNNAQADKAERDAAVQRIQGSLKQQHG